DNAPDRSGRRRPFPSPGHFLGRPGERAWLCCLLGALVVSDSVRADAAGPRRRDHDPARLAERVTPPGLTGRCSNFRQSWPIFSTTSRASRYLRPRVATRRAGSVGVLAAAEPDNAWSPAAARSTSRCPARASAASTHSSSALVRRIATSI